MTQVVALTKALKKGTKKGLTAEQLADRTGIKLNSVRAQLWTLQKAGEVKVIGTLPGNYGRPANLYTV